VFLIASYLVNPAKRAFPSNIVIYQFVCMCIFVSTFSLFGLDMYSKVWCADATDTSTQQNNWRCGLQGVVVVFGSMSVGTWWVLLSFNLYIQIVREKLVPTHWERYYHMFAWGLPSVIVIIAVGLGAFQYTYETAFCFLHYDINVFGTIQYPLFYLPLGLLTLTSALIMARVWAKIIMHFYRSSKIFERRKAHSFDATARILLLCLYILFMFCWLFAFRLYVQIYYNADEAEVLSWALCKLKSEVGFPDPGQCSGEIPVAISFAFQMADSVILSSSGIVLFCIFGSDRRIYKAWHDFYLLQIGEISKTKSQSGYFNRSPLAQPSTTDLQDLSISLQKTESHDIMLAHTRGSVS